MAKGFQGMPGNMNNLMKQAQRMQQQMGKVQEELEKKTLEVSSGGGTVTVVVTGKKQLQSITISPDVVDPDDVEMLQDLVLTAVNEALRQIEEENNAEMGKITGGLNLPGGFF